MANKKGNPQNFIPLNERSPEEARKIQSKGGKKSQQVQKEKKAMNEVIQLILNSELTDDVKKQIRKRFGQNISDEFLTTRFLLMQSLFNIASKQDEMTQNRMAAIRMIAEFAGESPAQIERRERMKADELKKSEAEDDPLSKSLEEMFGNKREGE